MSISPNHHVISYSGADAAEAAASLDAAVAALDFPAEVVCVALASHDGMLQGVATVRLIEVVDPDAVPAVGGSTADEGAIDDIDASLLR
ncbi:hypothetical protein [Agrococcus sp. SGAir0287]|uniref:hypothetical protein n=1 Tax=Agrococcus sp. SGAir0287 TaxID=2070347 RepID=UPI0010CCCA00|nr:hypothetical protein [Agrococcus sp. SGAir0287]QCR20142.1 hypothetical protein C1N71_12410 [Agrococcus sp. SGAir0287]